MADKTEHRLSPQANYETSLAMARERLGSMDFSGQCGRAGLEPGPDGVSIPFLDRQYFLDKRSLELSARDGGPQPEIWESIVILHHLIAASGAPLTGDLISYQQVPDGAPYYQNFVKRTSGILLPRFGAQPDNLLSAAKKIGAVSVGGLGDLAFKLSALPRVHYWLVCWRADEEFGPDLKILFDASLPNYLPAEDITVLAQMICLKLVRS